MKSNLTLFLVLMALVLLTFYLFKQCADKSEQIEQIDNFEAAKADSISREKVIRVNGIKTDSAGNIKVTYDTTELASMRSKWLSATMYKKSADAEIERLRRMVVKTKEQLQAAIRLSTITSGSGIVGLDYIPLSGDTGSIVNLGTTAVSDTGKFLPVSDTAQTNLFRVLKGLNEGGLVRSYTLQDKWATIRTLVNYPAKDSTKITYKIKEDYSLVTSYKKTGLFGWGQKQSFVHVNSLNPNTITDSLQSYQILPPPKKFYQTTVFKWAVGAVAGFLGAWEINKNMK